MYGGGARAFTHAPVQVYMAEIGSCGSTHPPTAYVWKPGDSLSWDMSGLQYPEHSGDL